MNAITLMLVGPLVGVQKRRPDVAHAITLEEFGAAGFGDRMPSAPCGAKHLRFAVVEVDGEERMVGWPIRAKGSLTRCRECWVATGKKRPRKAVA